jgi:uncharacterized membrane-anchored protein YjiN (DUF445 family)
VLSEPHLRQWVATVWADVKAELSAQAADPSSALRRRATAAIASAGRRLRDDAELRATAQDAVERGVRYVAVRFDGEIAALVSGTIDRWDAKDTSRRLELLLGPDLQFIRINGTVVGGLAGIALHALAQVL